MNPSPGHGAELGLRAGELPDLPMAHELLPLAWRAARAAGDLLLSARGARLEVDTKTSRTDVVTQMDRAAEDLLVRILLGDRPDDGLLGEEGSVRPGTTGVRWIMDPLDGTVNYLYRLPGWAVSVAAEIEGEVQVGVVDVPVYGHTYVTVRGGGAVRVDAGEVRPLVPNRPADLGQALVGTGFGYAATRRAAQARTLALVLPQVRDIRRGGAAAVDLCWTAEGLVDCYYERGLNPWDFAAGVLVATEAGLVAGGPDGGPPSTELTWLAPPHLAQQWAQLLTVAGADQD